MTYSGQQGNPVEKNRNSPWILQISSKYAERRGTSFPPTQRPARTGPGGFDPARSAGGHWI